MSEKRFEYGVGDKGPLIYDNKGVDDYYFINDYDKVAKSTVLYLKDKWVAEYGLQEGLYWFDAEGVMTDRYGNQITG